MLAFHSRLSGKNFILPDRNNRNEHVDFYCPVLERFPGKHRRQRVRSRVEAVGVLPLRRAVPHQRDVAGAEGQSASAGAYSVLRRQFREGTDQRADR